eukprot:3271055-Pleurochrysis_carterae.AAC.1
MRGFCSGIVVALPLRNTRAKGFGCPLWSVSLNLIPPSCAVAQSSAPIPPTASPTGPHRLAESQLYAFLLAHAPPYKPLNPPQRLCRSRLSTARWGPYFSARLSKCSHRALSRRRRSCWPSSRPRCSSSNSDGRATSAASL